MSVFHLAALAGLAAPAGLMATAALLASLVRVPYARLWRLFMLSAGIASALTGLSLLAAGHDSPWPGVVQPTALGQVLALLVQLLGTVIGGFSSRYLQGEPGQRRCVVALASVLAGVHVLLLADSWWLLVAAWATVGAAMQHLLCFYPDRPFALLGAHKKRIADRAADALLIAAATLAWREVGNASLSSLFTQVALHGMSTPLQWSAVALVLAVVLRSALLPVHGWLIQVMEAPTPVSALLHAGVVNLGAFVLIRFAPLLEQAAPARVVLVAMGLATAVLAGLVMLTRVSIKVRLAWSTVAQMGFMLVECGLGLYSLAALHLVGHSLYKAQAFLAASTVVRQVRLQALRGAASVSAGSLAVAPLLAVLTVILTLRLAGHAPWPWWWSSLLGLAWAPLLWLPAKLPASHPRALAQAASGLLLVAGLTAAARVAHALPLGLQDQPHHRLGLVALAGMAALYLCLALLQVRPYLLSGWRRWSYAGFYVDEAYTRLALRIWPARWTPQSARPQASPSIPALLADAPR